MVMRRSLSLAIDSVSAMPHDGLQIREARIEDTREIARVHVDSWRETYAGVVSERYFTEEAFERRAAFWSRYLALDPRPGRFSVATQGERIIGFATSGDSVGPHAERGYAAVRPLTLFSIYVLAHAHGTGAGQALHDAVLDQAPAQLWVLKGNGRAMAFYERNGFRLDGVEYTDPADPNLIELRMVR